MDNGNDRGHAFVNDPPVMSTMRRETCTRCGRARLTRPDGTSYGSATEEDCPTIKDDDLTFTGDPDNDDDVVEFFMRMSIPELRRRQDLTTQQITTAYHDGATSALEHLRRQHNLLSTAVYKKAFGSAPTGS